MHTRACGSYSRNPIPKQTLLFRLSCSRAWNAHAYHFRVIFEWRNTVARRDQWFDDIKTANVQCSRQQSERAMGRQNTLLRTSTSIVKYLINGYIISYFRWINFCWFEINHTLIHLSYWHHLIKVLIYSFPVHISFRSSLRRFDSATHIHLLNASLVLTHTRVAHTVYLLIRLKFCLWWWFMNDMNIFSVYNFLFALRRVYEIDMKRRRRKKQYTNRGKEKTLSKWRKSKR